MALIEVKHVTKHFGEKVALDDVSIDIPEGKIFGLLGPNGAGKSTLIRIINRITMATAGEVWFNGRPITDDDVAHIGYLPEERGLYRKMKVGDQAMYLAQLRGMSSRDAARALKDWFVRFGIQDWWNKKVEELSKGMAQKVQFITTVVHKPSLMILDEPFSGFDPVNADLIRKEILRLKEEGATIILSTHNMESVEELHQQGPAGRHRRDGRHPPPLRRGQRGNRVHGGLCAQAGSPFPRQGAGPADGTHRGRHPDQRLPRTRSAHERHLYQTRNGRGGQIVWISRN